MEILSATLPLSSWEVELTISELPFVASTGGGRERRGGEGRGREKRGGDVRGGEGRRGEEGRRGGKN